MIKGGLVTQDSMIQSLDFNTLISKDGIPTHLYLESKKFLKITPSRNAQKKFIKEHGSKITSQFRRWFKVLQDTTTLKRVREGMEYGDANHEWYDEMIELTSQFMNFEFKPSMVKLVSIVGDEMTKRINRELNKSFTLYDIKQLGFNSATENIMEFVKKESMQYITFVSEGLKQTFRDVFLFMSDEGFALQHAQYFLRDILPCQVRGPYHYGHALRYWRTLKEEGVLTKTQIRRKVNLRILKLRQLRMNLIRRTELSRTFNFGNQESMKQAKDSGIVKEVWKVRNVVMDGNEQHGNMDGEKVKIDEPYSNGEMYPGQYSFNCRCTETYTMEK